MTIDSDIFAALERRGGEADKIDVIGDLTHHNPSSIDARVSALTKTGRIERIGRHRLKLAAKDAPRIDPGPWTDQAQAPFQRVLLLLAAKGPTRKGAVVSNAKVSPKVIDDMIAGGHAHYTGEAGSVVAVGRNSRMPKRAETPQEEWNRRHVPLKVPAPHTPVEAEGSPAGETKDLEETVTAELGADAVVALPEGDRDAVRDPPAGTGGDDDLAEAEVERIAETFEAPAVELVTEPSVWDTEGPTFDEVLDQLGFDSTPAPAARATIYLCGPMSNLPDFNYPEFHRVANILRAVGYQVENPAENNAPECGTYIGWIRLALAKLINCNALAYLDGWENSKGAHIEIRTARDLDMPIKHWQAWL